MRGLRLRFGLDRVLEFLLGNGTPSGGRFWILTKLGDIA
jgi:hypothetical protein